MSGESLASVHEPWGALLVRAYTYLRRSGVDGRQAASVVAELTEVVKQSNVDAGDYDWVQWLQAHPLWQRRCIEAPTPWPRLHRASIAYRCGD